MQVPDLVSAVIGSGNEETDQEFLTEVRHISRRGLATIGVLGLLGTVFYVLLHLLFLDYQPGWSYSLDVPGAKVLVMWDKLVLAVLSLVALLAARMEAGRTHGRLILGLCVLGAACGMVVDQAAGGQSEYFVGYLTLLMFAAVGGVPFRPGQVVVMCMGILALMLIVPPILALAGYSAMPIVARQLIYWVVCSVVLTGIAILVYRSRYEEFRHRREIEKAEELVRQHAADLERSTAELELQKRTTEEQSDQLRQMEALKSRFFAGISHEFRTPITLILGPSKDALAKYGPEMDPEIRQAFALIQRSGHRLHDLVDQLLDLSRLEAGRLPLHASRQDIGAFVRGVVSIHEPIASGRRLEVSFESSLEDAEIWFDPEHLFKVFSNLLSNAVKFTADGGRIRVRVDEGSLDGDDAVAISVKDNGSGIPSDHLPLIFDRFYRVEKGDGPPPGSGVGLALVKELVELHGGEVTVVSEPGFGSEFVVTLRRDSDYLVENGFDILTGQPPHLETIVPSEAPEELGPDVAANSAPAPGCDVSLPTILVVEDNDDMRRYLRSILASHYLVLEAANGREGLRKAVTEAPALVLTDIMMPEMSGLALCSALKADEQTSHIPVVILTAKASHEALIEGLSSGADDYITKPFDATELIIRTENLIEIRSLLLKKSSVFEPQPAEVDEPSADEVFAGQVTEIVEKRLGDSNFTVDWLADEVGLSRRQLERRLRKISRLTPAGFIRLMRLKRAAQLLEKKVGTVSEVSYRVGFNDPNYFSRLFHQAFGVPPSEYPED
ncbi:MAG TPA: ATP-binding protein [Rhodothermales bacterium]|nr:ATP-binding protein [Rhodothermales bacterium]